MLQFSNTDIGLAGSAYIAGAVLGAMFFGWLTDRLGRKKLFFITLTVYLVATAATALSWNVWSFMAFRFVTGAGIGGEYVAINSTIQELVPARVRGWTDLAINGSFWVGAAIGAAGSVVLLDPAFFAPDIGWRLAFLIGAALAVVIFFMRLWIPESPRWLMTHNRAAEAEAIVAAIESDFRRRGHQLPPGPLPTIRLRARTHTPLAEVAVTLLRAQRRRTLVGLSLMAAQAFFYNAIFFTYALILTEFYGIRADHVGWYILPFAAGNFLGPIILGRLFDTVGRRQMLAFTYAVSGLLLALTGFLFARELLSAVRADHRLDGHLLLCLRGGERGISDSERDVSAGDPSPGYRLLLRHRHGRRRHRGAVAVRGLDRDGLAYKRVRGLPGRRGADDCCGGHRGRVGCRCRAQAAGDREPAAGLG